MAITAKAPTETGDIADDQRTRRDVLVGLLFAAIILTSIAVLAVSLLFPETGESGWLTYSTVHPGRAFIWGFLTLAGANIVVTTVAISLAALLVVKARGWRWVTAGAALAILGGAFYAVGVGGWAMLYFFATESTALDPASATAFLESVDDNALRLFGAAGGGALTVGLGALMIAIGLWRSGSVPKWLPIVMVVGTIITFVLPTEGVVGALVESPSAITSVLIGWYAWQRRHGLATVSA